MRVINEYPISVGGQVLNLGVNPIVRHFGTNANGLCIWVEEDVDRPQLGCESIMFHVMYAQQHFDDNVWRYLATFVNKSGCVLHLYRCIA